MDGQWLRGDELMRRPGQEGGEDVAKHKISHAAVLKQIRAFLIPKALKGNEAALHLLKDLGRNVGAVQA